MRRSAGIDRAASAVSRYPSKADSFLGSHPMAAGGAQGADAEDQQG